MITKILFGLLVGIAAYFLLADALKLPTVRTSRAVNNLSKRQTDKTSSLTCGLATLLLLWHGICR